jgi:twinkle protein
VNDFDSMMMPSVDDVDYVQELGKLDSKAYLLAPRQLAAKASDWILNPPAGLFLPWYGCDLLKIVPRRWSIWSGPTFSGKTNFLRFLMLWALGCREKVLFCSFEEDPEEVVAEFVYMAAGQRHGLNRAFVDWCVDHWDERLWVFNHTGFISPEVVLGAICYAAAHYGVTQIVVDSVMKLDIRKDDWDGQRRFANTLDRVVRAHNCHIHLVIHPKKTPNSQDLMDMNDVEGAKDLLSQAHSVNTMQRVAFDSPARIKMKGFPERATSMLRSWKQRGHNKIGSLALYFHPRSRQWLVDENHEPIQFLPTDAFLESGLVPDQTGLFT